MIAARSNAASGGGTCSSRKRYHVRYGSVMEAWVRECRQFSNTLLPNWNLRWEAIDDDVLVAVGEQVTRAVRIMADDATLGIQALADVVAGDAGGMRLLAGDAADLGDAIVVAREGF
jgi:hypothetical protein